MGLYVPGANTNIIGAPNNPQIQQGQPSLPDLVANICMQVMQQTLPQMLVSMGFEINAKKTNEDAVIPTQAHVGDAGWDLYSCEDAIIPPGETVMLDTGIAMALPIGTAGMIYARSGLSTREGLRPSNCVGVVDSGYTNSIKVPLYNDSNESRTVTKGQRIAQMVIQRFVPAKFKEVKELPKTDRGLGGFGSSGKF